MDDLLDVGRERKDRDGGVWGDPEARDPAA
jgi:hypothetical protein